MQAVHMPYRPKKKREAAVSGRARGPVATGPMVTLPSVNTFSSRPVPPGCPTARAYAKGRLADMPGVAWDDE